MNSCPVYLKAINEPVIQQLPELLTFASIRRAPLRSDLFSPVFDEHTASGGRTLSQRPNVKEQCLRQRLSRRAAPLVRKKTPGLSQPRQQFRILRYCYYAHKGYYNFKLMTLEEARSKFCKLLTALKCMY